MRLTTWRLSLLSRLCCLHCPADQRQALSNVLLLLVLPASVTLLAALMFI
jgi:hypothetical protein